MSSEDIIKSKIQTLAGPIFENRDWERFDEIFAPDFIDHDPDDGQPAGVEGIRWFWRNFEAAFPDFVAVADVIDASDEYGTLVLTLSGTNTGEYLGHPPTGKKFSARGIQVARYDNGLIIERWGSSDVLGIERRLGLS